MTDTEIRKAVDEFVALPRAERKAKFFSLPAEVQKRARKVIEARRGIAYRADGGLIVRTKEEYINQILRLSGKLAEMPARVANLKDTLVEFKRQLQENYGDEALSEVENALEKASAAGKDE